MWHLNESIRIERYRLSKQPQGGVLCDRVAMANLLLLCIGLRDNQCKEGEHLVCSYISHASRLDWATILSFTPLWPTIICHHGMKHDSLQKTIHKSNPQSQANSPFYFPSLVREEDPVDIFRLQQCIARCDTSTSL